VDAQDAELDRKTQAVLVGPAPEDLGLVGERAKPGAVPRNMHPDLNQDLRNPFCRQDFSSKPTPDQPAKLMPSTRFGPLSSS
jgi:hypothetical protein